MVNDRASPPRRIPSWWKPNAPANRPARAVWPRRAILAVVVVVAIAAAAFVARAMVERGHHHSIKGALDVGSIQFNSGCRLAPLYQGIAKGTAVIVTDTTGAIVGRSTLGPGKDVGPYCEFLFTAQVPDRTMYRIEVDHRGGVLYSKAYLDFYHWNAGLALRGTRLTWL